MAKKTGGEGSSPSVPLSEYIARRDRVMHELGDGVACVFAGGGAAPLHGYWEPTSDFYYLTGIASEAGAVVMFDPKNPDPTRRCVLFLRPVNPEMDQWEGWRDTISAELKARYGFRVIQRLAALPRALTAAARRQKKLSCLHPFSVYDAPAGDDLKLFRSVAERVLGVSVEDRTNLLPSLRAVKSEIELACMGKAIEATAAGYAAAMRVIRPGSSERRVHQVLERTYQDHGCQRNAYNPIVGAGKNSTVLHYNDNDKTLRAGELLLIDSAGSFEHYAADVTRTYPIGGKFGKEQREVYEVVLRSQEAAIKKVRPGVWMWEVELAAREVIEKAGYADYFPHGIGHQLGLDTHDSTPDGPLVEGMVVTIEPGVYLPEKGIGVRIEDDILVTSRGSKNLTEMIPKAPGEVEKVLG